MALKNRPEQSSRPVDRKEVFQDGIPGWQVQETGTKKGKFHKKSSVTHHDGLCTGH